MMDVIIARYAACRRSAAMVVRVVVPVMVRTAAVIHVGIAGICRAAVDCVARI